MKALILYRSKYGATKKYVDMLQEALDCDVYALESCHVTDFESYDWILFAGGIYASGISGLNQFQKKCGKVDHAKIAVFCVGASPFDENALADIKARNLRDNWKDVPLFYGRGAWDESKMSWKDRTLCKLLQKAVAKKDPAACEPWMEALLSAAGQTCDWTDARYLTPLLTHIGTG